MITAWNHPLTKKLIDAGVIPSECSSWELILSPNNVVKIKSEVFVTEEQFQKIADALLADPPCKDIVREFVFKSFERENNYGGIKVEL